MFATTLDPSLNTLIEQLLALKYSNTADYPTQHLEPN